MTEWMFCIFSNVTADVRCEEIKGKSCVNFEDKSLKHQAISSVCFRTNYEPKGHDSVLFPQGSSLSLNNSHAEYKIKMQEKFPVVGNLM